MTQMKTSDVPNNQYPAPPSKIYKGELIVLKTGETGSIMNDSDLNKVIAWCEKCRSKTKGYRITGENIYLYQGTPLPEQDSKKVEKKG
tara:strand:+ start:65 stop:328 length:264 start_codon:yes stop_codon:yes gene_type:complete